MEKPSETDQHGLWVENMPLGGCSLEKAALKCPLLLVGGSRLDEASRSLCL